MTLTLPPARFAGKALLIAVFIGSIAFFGFLAVGPQDANPTAAFSAGSFIAALLGAWLAGLGEPAPEKPAEPKSVFVGNLAFKARPEELQALFASYGNVHSVRIMTDRATRRPRGFAFVEMDGPAADRAIAALDGHEFLGRKLRVNEGNERRRPEQREREAA